MKSEAQGESPQEPDLGPQDTSGRTLRQAAKEVVV